MELPLETSLRGGEYRKLRERLYAPVRECYNLKLIEIDILYFLFKYAPCDTSTQIREKLNLNKGHISQAIDSLEQKGFISATPDARDHRFKHYSLSDAAMPAVADICKIRQQIDALLLEDISSEELAVYKKVAFQIFKNIEKLL